MLETITYIAKLLFLSDLLNPSASNIRSVFFIFINYIEIYFDFAFWYMYFNCFGIKNFIYYIYSSFEHPTSTSICSLGMILIIIQNCINFYFLGIVLTYFVNNFRTRKFIS